MVNGGGHPTHQWFGMYYAGLRPNQKVLPVPIFQAAEDFAIFGILLLVERFLRNRAPAVASDGSLIPRLSAPLPPAGIVLGVGMVLWGIERFLDEHLWLGEDGHLGRYWCRSQACRSRSSACSSWPRGRPLPTLARLAARPRAAPHERRCWRNSRHRRHVGACRPLRRLRRHGE